MDFFIASRGNDANPGTHAAPFATLERAPGWGRQSLFSHQGGGSGACRPPHRPRSWAVPYPHCLASLVN